MNFENPTALARVAGPDSRRLVAPANVILALGCAVLVLPTMLQVARDSWSTEQGGHGPLVLATGLWALWRELRTTKLNRRPGHLVPSLLLLGLTLGLFIVARITGVLEVEALQCTARSSAAHTCCLGRH